MKPLWRAANHYAGHGRCTTTSRHCTEAAIRCLQSASVAADPAPSPNREMTLQVPTLLLVAALHSTVALALQPVPTAVIADPPSDSKFPARMEVINVRSSCVQINGVD